MAKIIVCSGIFLLIVLVLWAIFNYRVKKYENSQKKKTTPKK
jgi:preprotein translocase subunit SecG